MPPLRLVFMGTPDFAVPALCALHEAGHEIAAVYCQPPKPAQRGQKIRKTPVHVVAEERGFVVRTPVKLKDAEEQAFLKSLAPDAIVVAAYGLLLPQDVLDIPRLGCLNIHGSLLPRWRGAAPIARALLAGDTETGITIMQMEAGLDTGPMLLKDNLTISQEDTAATLHDALADRGARLIVRALDERDRLVPEKQDDSLATYAAKLTREDGRVDWHCSAQEIDRQIRALTPWPGSFFVCEEENVKILEAQIISHPSAPSGALLDEDLTVACHKDALRLIKVQRPGRSVTDGASFLRGLRLHKGHVFA